MYYRYWIHLAHLESPPNYTYYGRACGATGTIDRDTAADWEVFDLEADPGEMKSFYGEHGYAEVVKELQAELQTLRRQHCDTDACGAVREDS